MNSPPTSPEYSVYHHLPQRANTRTESCTTIQNSSINYYLHQYQQAECRTLSTITANSTNSTLYHQNPADKTESTTKATSTSATLDSNGLTSLTPTNSSTLNSSETIPLSPTRTHTYLNSNELISIPLTTTTTTTAAAAAAAAVTSFPSSSPDTLAYAVPTLSLPISSTPAPPLTPNSPPARQLNFADIRPLLETIDRTAPAPAYPQSPLSRIEGAETLLEIRYGRRERSREGTVEPELELARPSSRPIVVSQPGDGVCGNGAAADQEGPRGGALWGSRLRAKTKRSVKVTA